MQLARKRRGENNSIIKHDSRKVKSSFIILLALLLANGIILFIATTQARARMQETSKELIITRMQDNVSAIEMKLVTYQQTLYSLSVDENVFWLKNWYEQNDLERIKLYNNVVQRVKSIEIPDAHILNLYICYPGSNIVIDNGMYEFIGYETVPEEYWSSLQSVEPNFYTTVHEDNGSKKITQFLMVHKIGAAVKKNGFIVMELDPDTIIATLEVTNNLEDESVCVTDTACGEQLYCEGSLSEAELEALTNGLDGKAHGIAALGRVKYFVSVNNISIAGWKYVTAVPLRNLIGVSMFDTSVWLMIFTCLVIALLFSIFGINMAYKPIDKLYNLAIKHANKPEQADKGIYLTRVFDRMLDENDNMRESIKKSLPVLREKVLMQIVMQEESENLHGGMLENLNINFGCEFFRIAVISYDINESSDTMEMLKVEVFNEYWKECLSEQGTVYIVLFEPKKFFFVINYEDETKDSSYWRDWFTKNIEAFKEEFSCDITGGMSLKKTSVKELNAAFVEALKTYERQIVVGPGFMEIYDKHYRFHQHQISYPFELTQNLLNILKTQDSKKADAVIGDIEEFFNQNPPKNQFVLRQILLHMSGEIRKLLIDTGIDEEHNERLDKECLKMIEAGNLKGYIQSLKKLAYKVQETYKQYYSSGRHNMVMDIKNYIEENYSKPITPTDIAKQFYISPTYLYRLMKSERNMSPAHYVTKIRCEKALAKLRDTELPVKTISKICGFDSSQSFYRNFKKAYGCTPSEYRNTLNT